jgi:hypothetical protein
VQALAALLKRSPCVKLALSSYSIRDHINTSVPINDFPRYAK